MLASTHIAILGMNAEAELKYAHVCDVMWGPT